MLAIWKYAYEFYLEIVVYFSKDGVARLPAKDGGEDIHVWKASVSILNK